MGVYDNVFHTIVNECPQLIIPLINETFGEKYTGEEKIEFLPTEMFMRQKRKPSKQRRADSIFRIRRVDNSTAVYHLECQSKLESNVMKRLLEYDTQIALINSELEESRFTAHFPRTAVIYLRFRKKRIFRTYQFCLSAMGKQLRYDAPLLILQNYTLNKLFEKNLLLLIPFYLFTKESQFKMYAASEAKLQELVDEFKDIKDRLDNLVREGKLSDFDRVVLVESTVIVVDELAKKYEPIKKGVETVMGGYYLKTLARKEREEGIEEGRVEGRVEGREEERKEIFLSLVGSGMSKKEAQRHCNISDSLVEEALKMSGTPQFAD